ncbi:MAG: hypothetical protein QXP45_03255 [Thermoproteota archaeon]
MYRTEKYYTGTYTFHSLIIQKLSTFFQAYMNGDYDQCEETLKLLIMDMPEEIYTAVQPLLDSYLAEKEKLGNGEIMFEYVKNDIKSQYAREKLLEIYRRLISEMHRKRMLLEVSTYMVIEELKDLAKEKPLYLEGRREAK